MLNCEIPKNEPLSSSLSQFSSDFGRFYQPPAQRYLSNDSCHPNDNFRLSDPSLVRKAPLLKPEVWKNSIVDYPLVPTKGTATTMFSNPYCSPVVMMTVPHTVFLPEHLDRQSALTRHPVEHRYRSLPCPSSPSTTDIGHCAPGTLSTEFESSPLPRRSPDPCNGNEDPIPDINVIDPLMTDFVGDADEWLSANSGLPEHSDVNQCTFCSAPYHLHSTGFLSFSSTSMDPGLLTIHNSVSPFSSTSHSPTSNCMSPSTSITHSPIRKRKPKFFRSSRFTHHSEIDHENRRYVLTCVNTGRGKRWRTRCDPAYARAPSRSARPHSRPCLTPNSLICPRAVTPTPFKQFNSDVQYHHSLQTDDDYLSDSTVIRTSSDHSPYAFDLSPASKRKEIHYTSRPQLNSTRATALVHHNSKRLHLLQFIIRLLRESKDKHNGSTRSWTVDTIAQSDGSVSPSDCVEWVDEGEQIFTIKNPIRLAQLWGLYKSNRNMTFESLCRSLRLYYVSGKLERIRGQRNQYRLLGPVRRCA